MKTALRWFGAAILVATSTFGLTSAASADDGHGGDHEGKVVSVQATDNCEPVSFNAALGAGSCVPLRVRPNPVTFGQFLTQFNPVTHSGPPTWRFTRTYLEIDREDSIKVTNTGGEAHSFTEVPFFGGGCVGILNQLTGLTQVAARCPADFATVRQPGQSATIANLAPGTHQFICIIHPWMRATVKVEGED